MFNMHTQCPWGWGEQRGCPGEGLCEQDSGDSPFISQPSGSLRKISQTAIAATTCLLSPCLAASHTFTFWSVFPRLCWPRQSSPTPGLFEFVDKFFMLGIPISHRLHPAKNAPLHSSYSCNVYVVLMLELFTIFVSGEHTEIQIVSRRTWKPISSSVSVWLLLISSEISPFSEPLVNINCPEANQD